MSQQPGTDVEVMSTAAIAPMRGGAIVTPAVTAAKALEAQQAYQELCAALLDSTDVMAIGKKEFRKKSAWRKLAVAFNVSVKQLERSVDREGGDGRILRATVVCLATAPNGREVDGMGVCDIFEKCCPGADDNSAGCKNKSQWHTHCPVGCDGRQHFSNPEHDLPATADTRAKNRACSDLFGMGEVSAEEVNQERQANYGGTSYHDEPPAPPWWEGFTSEEEAKAANDELRETIKAMAEADIADVKAKMAAAGIPNNRAWRKAECDTIDGWLNEPTAREVTYPESGGASDDAEPTASASDKPLDVAFATDEELLASAPADAVDGIVEGVQALDPEALDAALVTAGKSKSGGVDTRRKRLVVHRLRESLAVG